MRCRHDWQQISYKHVPPSTRSMKGEGPAAHQIMQDLIYGYTVISLRCVRCGDVATRKMLGEWALPQKGVAS